MPDSPAGIDPRGPRFAAGITTVLLVVATYLALTGVSPRLGQETASFGWFAYQPLADAVYVPGVSPVAQRIADAGFVAVAIAAALFLWGVLSPRTAPWGVVFRRLVRPRLAPPSELEDPRPPRFAQLVGLVITALGVLGALLGAAWAVPLAAAFALVAAFLNAVFGLCLGCELYLLVVRLRARRP